MPTDWSKVTSVATGATAATGSTATGSTATGSTTGSTATGGSASWSVFDVKGMLYLFLYASA